MSETLWLNVNALKEAFKLPALIGLGDTKVAYRDVSCYCDMCIINDLCSGWTQSVKRKKEIYRGTRRNAATPTSPHLICSIAHTSGGTYTEIVPSAVRATMSQLFMKTLSAESHKVIGDL